MAAHNHGVTGRAVSAHTDCIDTYAEAAGYLSRRLGRYVAGVVGTVGEQNHHLGLSLGILQTRDGVGKTHAYGGAVADEAILSHVAL